MKSLLDIQQDIRNLENNIQKMTKSIKGINSDIETLRNSSVEMVIDYSKIEILAKQIPFKMHPLSKLKNSRACKVYLEMLLYIVRLDSDEKTALNRMVFMQWLLNRAKVDYTLEDLYKDCLEMDQQSYYNMIEEIPHNPHNCQEIFLVDALMVANISGTANMAIYEYIADLAVILGISEQVKSLAVIAKIALCQSITGIDRERLYLGVTNVGRYRCYISDNFVNQMLNTLRTIEAEVHVEAKNLVWYVKGGDKVQAGDTILEYAAELVSEKKQNYHYQPWKSQSVEYKSKTIKSSTSGVVYKVRYNNYYYAVVAHENDDLDAIRLWVRARR